MRKAILFDKHLSGQYKDLTQTLIALMTHKQEFITDVARMYTQLPLFLHSVNLVRWYALYRNDGEYNKDTYFQAIKHIRRIIADQSTLKNQGS